MKTTYRKDGQEQAKRGISENKPGKGRILSIDKIYRIDKYNLFVSGWKTKR